MSETWTDLTPQRIDGICVENSVEGSRLYSPSFGCTRNSEGASLLAGDYPIDQDKM